MDAATTTESAEPFSPAWREAAAEVVDEARARMSVPQILAPRALTPLERELGVRAYNDAEIARRWRSF